MQWSEQWFCLFFMASFAEAMLSKAKHCGVRFELYSANQYCGLIVAAIFFMFEEEFRRKIQLLEAELEDQQKAYTNAVRSHTDYTTLRAIRERMRGIKSELQSLYEQERGESLQYS